MARVSVPASLNRLETLKDQYGADVSRSKIELVRRLGRARLGKATQVLRFHEALCFLRAYPDDEQVLLEVDLALDRFFARSDVRAFKEELADTGIAGAPIHYPLFWPMARWIARRWPRRLLIDWSAIEDVEPLRRALMTLVPEVLRPALTSASSPELFMRRVAGDKADGAWLVDAIEHMPGDDRTRETFHDGLDTPYRIDAGDVRPSRTVGRHPPSPVVFVQSGLTRARPSLAEELNHPPLAVRETDRREGQALVDLANEAMVTRSRDLEAFGFGNPDDVHVVSDRRGLEFALIGVHPSRRLLLPSAFGLVSLQSGMPVGYVQVDVLGTAAEISFNTFETFRGGEAALVFARMLALCRFVLGADTFSIEPYQLGDHNKEAVESGAFWFYWKMGFRPELPAQLRIAEREVRAMAKRRGHRSSPKTLEALARGHVFFDVDPRRKVRPPSSVVLEKLSSAVLSTPLEEDGLEFVRRRFEVPARTKLSADERRMLDRWSPILARLPGVERWSRAERRSAFDVLAAKAGADERAYLNRYRAHPKLDRALLALAGLR